MKNGFPSHSRRISRFRIGVVCLVLLAAAGSSLAATFTVNSTADAVDSNPGNGVCATAGGVCTLRAAIQETNVLAGGPHTIILPAGTYLLTRAGTGEDIASTGDLDIRNTLTITGAGAQSTIIDANNLDRCFDVSFGFSLSLSGVTVQNGNAGNAPGGGFNVLGSTLTLTDSTIKTSTARQGGAIELGDATAVANLTRVTLSGNTATGNDGGGIDLFNGKANLVNVTMSGNATTSGVGEGGAIYIDGNGASATLTNCTLASNSSTVGGGGLRRNRGSMSLKNTIVASNTGGNCSGTITSNGNNLDSANTCAFTGPGDRINTDPLLGTLQNNGGPTDTHALLAGSPAIDAGTATGAPATDQRGVARPQGAGYDIGAFEGTSANINGKVFEDVNYGGGAGRNWATASANGGSARSSVRVELYNNAGAYVIAVATDGSGNYSFAGLGAGSYTIRVVDNTVTSSRGGSGLLPVLTYRTNAGSGTAVGVTDYVGGQNPAVADAPYGAAGAVMNTTTGVFTAGIAGTAQSFAPVTISTSTVSGVDFGLNFDTIVNTNNAGRGSLRQFLTTANALGNGGLAQAGRTAGIESAIFMISNGSSAPGLRASLNYFSGGVATIAPASALPAIADPAILNAQTQPGFAGTPIVRLDGAGAGGGANGLSLAGGGAGSTVRGLMLTRFSNDGLVIQAGANGVIVAGNWIGTDGGSTPLGNWYGIEIFGANATIGGTGANDRNVIVNNGNDGISVSGASASGNVIRGNYIGLEPDGTSGAGNGDVGIALLAGGGSNTIGGLTAAERNVISMNFEGIEISCANNVVQGNYIGTDAGGTLNLGQHSSDAVQIIAGGTGNVIGGTAPGAGNLIAFTKSGKSGVSVQAGTGNAVLGNSIHSNTALGIDLGNNGVVTANDGVKTAGQPNLWMDFPVFTSATLAGTTLTVAGYIGIAPNDSDFANARVEIFKSDNDPSGNGEGQTYFGFLTADGNGNFSGSLTVSGLAAGDRITGTATDGSGNTSEFGPNATVGGAYAVSGTVYEDVNYGGGAGRDRASSSGVVRSGARVELYDNAGAYVTFTTSDGSGNYSFPGLTAGNYTVRAVDNTVTSSRGGSGLLPVLTYRTNAGSGTAVGVTDYVGGQNPAVADAPNGAAGAVMNTTSGVFTAGISGQAQSFSPITISTGTVSGVDFGFNFDTVTNTNDTGRGSLRQVLTTANTLGNGGLAQAGRPAGIESAIFMISNGTAAPGLRASLNYFSGGVATIAPTSALPSITDPAILNAQTQPGWTATPIVELNGAGAGAVVNGITITAGGTTVRGLVVNRFTRSGILLSAAGNNTVAGNYIGATASGTGSAANGAYGVEITGSGGNVIGGSATADRNVIAWNTNHGIYIDGTGSGNNAIAGNYIGVDATGAAAAPNRYGIWINGTSGNTIGGSAASQRNVISGNTWSGIRIEAGGSNNTIRGNYIGTNASGNASLPNNIAINLMGSSGNTIGGTGAGEGNVLSGNTNFGIQVAYEAANNVIQGNTIGLDPGRTVAIPNTSHGIAFNGAATPPYPTGNTVGGAAAGAGNVISGNRGAGIEVVKGTGNAIRTNSIYGNGWIGIDLGYDNVTTNNGTKDANLPNYNMDFPVLTNATLSGTTLTVSGYVGNAPNQSAFANARVEIFRSDNDPSGYGEGQSYLGFLTADGNGNFSGSLTVSGLAAGDRITGTATDGSGNTSEFGANVVVAAPGYQPDAMIKLASEGGGAYATDNVYEAAAATQVKFQGVVSASTAIYNVLFQNDGNVSDNVVITQAAADNCAGFTVQYLDNSSTDRTAAVTGGGYTISGMAAGGGTTWTLRVTPAGTTNGGSPACGVSVTATSAGNGTKVDQVRAVTSSTSANLTLLKNADRATVAPGQDITYTVNASNGGGLTTASAVVVTDRIPAYTGFKVGSATFSPGTSTLSLSGGAPSYSSDNGATWAYGPVSGGCAAPVGYDFCVTDVRWTTTGTMPAGTGFTVNFVVRVK